jgi:hypothetical protein
MVKFTWIFGERMKPFSGKKGCSPLKYLVYAQHVTLITGFLIARSLVKLAGLGH